VLGNASEWVSDWSGFYTATEQPVRNPKGPPEGTDKIIRGGNILGPENISLFVRAHDGEDGTSGFRCAGN
jgi:sulfatase modifying factor 1